MAEIHHFLKRENNTQNLERKKYAEKYDNDWMNVQKVELKKRLFLFYFIFFSEPENVFW